MIKGSVCVPKVLLTKLSSAHATVSSSKAPTFHRVRGIAEASAAGWVSDTATASSNSGNAMKTGSRCPTVATSSGTSSIAQSRPPRASAISPLLRARATRVPPTSISPSVAGWYWPL